MKVLYNMKVIILLFPASPSRRALNFEFVDIKYSIYVKIKIMTFIVYIVIMNMRQTQGLSRISHIRSETSAR